MNKRAYRVLEFDKIKALLAMETASELTRRKITELEALTAPYIVRQKLAETTEAVTVIMRKGALPLGSFEDISQAVGLAEKGGTLSMRQLLDVGFHLTVARKAAVFLKSDLPELPVLDGLRSVIAENRRLEERIETCVLSETEMADNASPELNRIRRKISLQNENIRNRMNRILNADSNRQMLQDTLVTMRQGRYVIPVKQEHRARFPGMIHDQSASGATLFIEPQAIVNMNNELRELELAEAREIERILAELSAEVAEAAADLANNQKLLVRLDLIFARGRLSVNMKGTPAAISETDRIRIKNGRHPLIDRDKVVPISLTMGGGYRTLIITGPNTGGKTVTLKTVGLFVLMTQAGLHVPADSGTEIPVLTSVFADIGDEQSIEQSLSTFSSHMTNIVDIVSESDERSLVLLDELGAGTDPTEGAALAIAVLEELRNRGTLTLATTHYTELKKYALSTEGVENASMEFNVETLSPTYRLQIGLPGRSNAFEISRKLGLPDAVIERASGLLDSSAIQFESVISSIEADRKTAEEERDEALFLKLSMKKQQEELARELQKLEEKKERVLRRAREEAKDIVEEARALSDEVQRTLRELPEIPDFGDRERQLQDSRRRIREFSGRCREQVSIPENPSPVRPDELAAGDRVNVLSLQQKGEVIAPPDDRGDVQVQVGRMKISVPLSGLTKIREDRKKAKIPGAKSWDGLTRIKVQSISPTINVRGENLDSAVTDVDKYLDDAFMAGLKSVTIIHGRGEGILRDGIHRMLKSHRHVKSFRRGEYSEGGDGVTIAEIGD